MIVHIFTEEEYTELLNTRDEDLILLRETNKNLKTKLAKLENSETPIVTAIDRSNSPFKVIDDTMSTATISDFVLLYNGVALMNKSSQLKAVDNKVFEYLQNTAEFFDYTSYFKDMSSVKAYRVNLNKKGLFKTGKKEGIVKLVKIEEV